MAPCTPPRGSGAPRLRHRPSARWQRPALTDLAPEQQALAASWATLLGNAKKPLIIAGTGARSQALLEAASNIARALKGRGQAVELALVAQETNSLGLAMLAGNAARWKPPSSVSKEKISSRW